MQNAFGGGMEHGPGTNPLNFAVDPDYLLKISNLSLKSVYIVFFNGLGGCQSSLSVSKETCCSLKTSEFTSGELVLSFPKDTTL